MAVTRPVEKVEDMSKEELDAVFPPEENDGWVKTGGGDEDIWDFEKNKTIEGLLIEVRQHVGSNDSNMYIIENKSDNTRYGVWGSTLIDGRFFDDQGGRKIPNGVEIRIEFAGMKTSEKSGRDFKNYEIYYRNPMVKA